MSGLVMDGKRKALSRTVKDLAQWRSACPARVEKGRAISSADKYFGEGEVIKVVFGEEVLERGVGVKEGRGVEGRFVFTEGAEEAWELASIHAETWYARQCPRGTEPSWSRVY